MVGFSGRCNRVGIEGAKAVTKGAAAEAGESRMAGETCGTHFSGL
jgi:hypothetical protein